MRVDDREIPEAVRDSEVYDVHAGDAERRMDGEIVHSRTV